MKKALLALLLALMWAGGQSPALAQSKNAQSQNKIIDRHRKAIGGSEVKRVRTTVLEGAVERDGASPGRFLYQAAAPDRLRIDVESDGSNVSESYNGKSAWRMDERGLRTLLGP
ncbi:MAG TPA: hypothetical protein VKC34_15655, partial [Blastocatellia bacterium]|nr:hypothetical protein [Blastocatellia bacterium]